jgi:hypothetical protein
LKEVSGDIEGAIALYRRIGWVDEYHLDGVLEAQRLERRHNLRTYFFHSRWDSYIEIEFFLSSYRMDSARAPDVKPYHYAKFQSDGRVELGLTNPELKEKAYTYNKRDTSLVSHFVSLLESSEFMLLRNQLSHDSNTVSHHFTTHPTLTRVNVHTPELDHQVFIKSLDLTTLFGQSQCSTCVLEIRLDSLATLVREALSSRWITDSLNGLYGTKRPFVGDDGVVRYDPATGTITRVYPHDLSKEWEANVAGSVPDTGSCRVCDSTESYPPDCIYVFDLGEKVLGICKTNGRIRYELPLTASEWPQLECVNQYLSFGRTRGRVAELELYDYRTGEVVVQCEVGADSSYSERLFRPRLANDKALYVNLLKRGALAILDEAMSNRPARDRHAVW